ncbi:LamG domain-containing protein [Catenovulum agarivorans]|uniref:LamG domain-containing protein n=1 Tax=Catenovulum agarivorans TaxID=1172192 RepID=UPI00030CDBC8|nr:LamG domain-containing protein [Catenovulum agarivorans]
MRYHTKLLIALFSIFLFASCTSTTTKTDQSEINSLVWHFDNLHQVGGFSTELEGSPTLITTPTNSTKFNGLNDRLQVHGNIIAGMQSFTLELIAKPLVPTEKGREPRIVHIEDLSNSKHRLTLEMRFNEQNQWYLDAFLLDGDSRYTLIDSSLTHENGRWYNLAITYENGVFTSYVNGKKELTAQVNFGPMSKQAQTSVGARMNKVHYFNGEIKKLRATPRVLSKEEMLQVE